MNTCPAQAIVEKSVMWTKRLTNAAFCQFMEKHSSHYQMRNVLSSPAVMNWISLTLKCLQYILARNHFAKNSIVGSHLTCSNFTPASSDIDFAYLGTVVGRHMIHAGTTTVTHDLSKG